MSQAERTFERDVRHLSRKYPSIQYTQIDPLLVEVLCPNAFGTFRFAVKASQQYPKEIPVCFTGKNARSPFIRDDFIIVHPVLESWKSNDVSALANIIAGLHAEFSQNAPQPVQLQTGQTETPSLQTNPGNRPAPPPPPPRTSLQNQQESKQAGKGQEAASLPVIPPQPLPCPQLTRAQMKYFTTEDLQDLDNEAELVKNFVNALEPVTQLVSSRDSVKHRVGELAKQNETLEEEMKEAKNSVDTLSSKFESAQSELTFSEQTALSIKNKFSPISLAHIAVRRRSDIEMLGESLKNHCLDGALTANAVSVGNGSRPTHTSSASLSLPAAASPEKDGEDAGVSPGGSSGFDESKNHSGRSTTSGKFSFAGGNASSSVSASAIAFASEPPDHVDLTTFIKNYLQIQKDYHILNAKSEILRSIALNQGSR